MSPSTVLLVFVVFTVSSFVKEVSTLSCYDCREITCEEPAGCTVGIASDICGCCKVCAQDVGEKCGGPWGVKGKCGHYLTCVKEQPGEFNSDGICKRIDEVTVAPASK